jgi:ElaB/YqjD/DUF883 family membrane-anchored ribosome-binding protein
MYDESERLIRERIDATRERLGETIEEIGERVNPGRVRRALKSRARDQVDEFKANVKRKARNTMRDVEDGVTGTGRGVWERIRENPIPAGMVGVGLAWLAANGRASGAASRTTGRARRVDYGGYWDPYAGEDLARYGTSVEEASGEEQSRTEELRDRAGEAAERVRDRGQEAVDSAREKTSELKHRAEEGMHDARERARQWGNETQYRARRVEHRVEDSVQENPIAAGMVAAALGFAAGMMVPESRRENEMFGAARDRLIERAGSTARRAGHKAKEVARETAGETARQAIDQVMHGDRGAESQGISEPGR